eukprot:TRINITY_DN519_c0_g1_i1.p1 TRINITY_DN519_c0_g1~~TRINITY_DN519_c0_g1_i1.p1  ORF type:complete len:272 (+),score=37.83 TRINITY_DN519_c0_g1_i1:57-872(+)
MSIRDILWGVGKAVRGTGNALHQVADALQLRPIGLYNKRCGHRRLISLGDRKPIVSQGVWIAPTASVIGSVQLGVNSTVWYGAVVRGDLHHIKIGVLSHIGDRCVVHVSSGKISGSPRGTIVGNNVVVEPGSVLHACTIEDGVKIGSNSIVFDGALIEKNAMVGPGSVVPANKRIPAGELWEGNPAKFVRKLEPEEISQVQATAESFFTLANKHETESSKSEPEILRERELEAAREDVWWGQGTIRQGVAQEHSTIKNYITPTREKSMTQT